MTKEQIKNIIDTATTSEELQPLYQYHSEIKAKEAKISTIIKVKEKQIESIVNLTAIKAITL
ncbi:unnamed protein product [marine sediment metagenome]|uniref:Uncharacterized protein n=1 Tax=marine sediment metagenome TaxID=412755 RepID=X0VJJ7_9ZZZZ